MDNKEHFRLNKQTFFKLRDLVAPANGKTDNTINPIPLPNRIAIGLRHLGKGDSFESLSLQFGVGE